MVPGFHFPKQAFALHLLLQRPQRLVDIIVTHNDLNDGSISCKFPFSTETLRRIPTVDLSC